MGMTIDEAVLELRWLKKVNQEILETDAKELDVDSAWIKHWESVTQALDIAIDTARKYQMMQAEYEARLKADMVAMLTDIQLEIEEKEQYYQDKFLESRNAVHDAAMGGRMFGCGECKDIIQQKINALKGAEDENKNNSNRD
jgi:hypothetical protein